MKLLLTRSSYYGPSLVQSTSPRVQPHFAQHAFSIGKRGRATLPSIPSFSSRTGAVGAWLHPYTGREHTPTSSRCGCCKVVKYALLGALEGVWAHKKATEKHKQGEKKTFQKAPREDGIPSSSICVSPAARRTFYDTYSSACASRPRPTGERLRSPCECIGYSRCV